MLPKVASLLHRKDVSYQERLADCQVSELFLIPDSKLDGTPSGSCSVWLMSALLPWHHYLVPPLSFILLSVLAHAVLIMKM